MDEKTQPVKTSTPVKDTTDIKQEATTKIINNNDNTKTQQIKQFNERKSEPNKTLSEDTTVVQDKSTKETIREAGTATKEKKLADKERADKERDAELARREKLNDAQNALQTATNVQERFNDAISPGINWLSNLPTPGGIATILLIMTFFVLAVIPVNDAGDTRLKLIWLTITGKTHLSYEGVNTPGISDTGGGSFAGKQTTDVYTNSHGPGNSNIIPINTSINFTIDDTLGLPAFNILFPE